jgi:hypothetical protein
MSQTKRFLLIALSAGLLYALFFITATGCGKRNEPSYHGILISEWLDKLGNPKSTLAEKERALRAVRSIGTNALPFLLSQVKSGRCIAGPRRSGVVEAFEALGESATSVVAELGRIADQADDDYTAYTALWALSVMGGPGAKAMSAILTNVNEFKRHQAAQILYSMGTNAHTAVPALLSTLGQYKGDFELAFWTGSTAVRATLQPDELIPVLITNLLQGSAECRYGSASGLKLLGNKAREASSALELLLQDTNESVRFAAYSALLSIKYSDKY